MAETVRTSPADQWLRYLEVEKGLAPATVKQYARVLTALETVRGNPAEASADELRTWLHDQGGGVSSVSLRVAALRSFFRYLVRSGIRADDPTLMIDTPKRRAGLPRPVRNWGTVRESLDIETRLIGDFLVETGLRISEACSIDVAKPCPPEILIRGKGGRERLVPLTPRARKCLDRLGGSLPIGPRAIQRRFAAHGFTPHQLRHLFGCSLAASGADLGEMQELLGHASPATTRTYTAYDVVRLRKALARRSRYLP